MKILPFTDLYHTYLSLYQGRKKTSHRDPKKPNFQCMTTSLLLELVRTA